MLHNFFNDIMALRKLNSALACAVSFLLLIAPNDVNGNAIASWWVSSDEEYAPQIFKYNETTGKIYASLCNSQDTPIFAQNDSTALRTTITPIPNTSIASFGYMSGSTLETNVFYLTELAGTGTTIASAPYTCNTTSGLWIPSAQPSYISNGTSCNSTAPTIDPAGGLSALYLSANAGMRVFFKTTEYKTHYLQYVNSSSTSIDDDDKCTGWSYVGIASNLTTGHEVASGFLPSKPAVWTIAQTVFVNESATEDTNGEVEISTSNADGVTDLWSINRMPTQIIAELKADNSTAGTLSNMSTTADSEWEFESTDSWGFTFDSFSGSSSRIGLSLNSGGIPSVFYIGTDGYLRRFSADTLGHWHQDDSEDEEKWPAADIANDNDFADFGLAYDTSEDRIWMFYESNGYMTQVHQSESSVWQDFTRLATSANSSTTNATSSSSSGSSSSSSSSSSNDSSLAIGLGVGLGLGIPLTCGAIALLFFRRYRGRRRNRSKYALAADSTGAGGQSSTAANTPDPSTPAGLDQNQGYWQDGVWVEKTMTEYYAGGVGPGTRHARQPLGELDVAGNKDPVYEMPQAGSAMYELPGDKLPRGEIHELNAFSRDNHSTAKGGTADP